MIINIKIDTERINDYDSYYSDKLSELKQGIRYLKDSYLILKEKKDIKESKIDEITIGISKSQRNLIIDIKEIIDNLEYKLGKIIPLIDIINEAREYKIDEDIVKECIEKLKRAGNIYSPNSSCISKI